MSVATQVARIQESAATIRSKFVELGISQSTDKIDALATASEQIENKGAVNATVSEGATYTIPKGYHNGSGTVTGVPPAEDAEVSSWETPDMVGNASPSPYSVSSSDSSDTAYLAFDGNLNTAWTDESELSQEKWITFDYGESTKIDAVGLTPSENTDRFPNSFDVYGSNDGENWTKINEDPIEVTVPPEAGTRQAYDISPSTYKAFKIQVSATSVEIAEVEFRTVQSVGKYALQAKTITPTTQAQNATPDEGFYGLSSVRINPIPANYKDTSVVTAVAEDVLSGKVIVNAAGQTVAGAMANNGAIMQTIDGLTTTSVTIAAGFTSGGSVSLDNSIEEALAEI